MPILVYRSLQYLQENVGDKVDFLPTDKQESFVKVDSINLGACIQACPKYSK